MKIRTKILLSSLPIILILTIFLVYSNYVTQQNEVARQQLALYQTVEVSYYNILIDINNTTTTFRQLLTDGYSMNADSQLKTQIEALKQSTAELKEVVDSNAILNANKRVVTLFGLTERTVAELEGVHQKDVLKLKEASVDAALKQLAFQKLKNEISRITQSNISIRNAIATQFEENKLQLVTQLQAQSKIMNMLTYISFVLVVVIPIAAAFAISHNLGKGIRKIITQTHRFSQGDLKVEFDSERKDEIGELGKSLQHMGQSLRELLQTIVNQSRALETQSEKMVADLDQMNQSSLQVAATADGVMKNVDEQNQSLANISSVTQQLSASVEEVTASTQVIVSAAYQTSSNAQDGLGRLEAVVHQIQSGSKRVNELKNTAENLNSQMDRIRETTKLINDITKQTDILSLNAAIEASRAGQAGKGFAVVSDEIRKLAEHTRQLSGQIEVVIESVSDDTKAVLREVAVTVEESKTSQKLAEQTMETFRLIVDASKKLSEQMDEIARGANEMSSGTNETAFSVSQIATGSEELHKQFSNVTEIMTNQTQSLGRLSEDSKRLYEVAKILDSMTKKYDA
jgi:methyl-accepting chemotaxis protein